MTENGNCDTLLMIYTIVRHGDRGPIEFLPNDLNKGYWGNQKGILTKQGKREAYELGLWYRKHYGGFLPTEYNSNDLYVYSTDCDRTLMTAQCILAAMYPPSEISQWHKNINWQPIPVHLNGHPIEEYDKIIEAYDNGSFPVASLIPKHENFLQLKSMQEEWHRHIYGESTISFRNIGMSIDNVATAMKHGLPYNLPPNFDFKALCLSVEDLVIGSLKTLPYGLGIGANILRKVGKYINQRVSKENSLKMIIYSAHDISISALLEQLDIHFPFPEFCGSATFELHKLADGNHYVKLQYRSKYDRDLLDIPIVGDEKYCPLQQFQKIVEEKYQINKYKN